MIFTPEYIDPISWEGGSDAPPPLMYLLKSDTNDNDNNKQEKTLMLALSQTQGLYGSLLVLLRLQ